VEWVATLVFEALSVARGVGVTREKMVRESRGEEEAEGEAEGEGEIEEVGVTRGLDREALGVSVEERVGSFREGEEVGVAVAQRLGVEVDERVPWGESENTITV